MKEYIYSLASHPDAPPRYASAGRALCKFEAHGFEVASPVMMPYGSVWVRKEVLTSDDPDALPRPSPLVRMARRGRRHLGVRRRDGLSRPLAITMALAIAGGFIVTALSCSRVAVERLAAGKRDADQFTQVHPDAVKQIPALRHHHPHKRRKK